MRKRVCIGTWTVELEAPATLLSMLVALAIVAWNLRDVPPDATNYAQNCRGVIYWHRR